MRHPDHIIRRGTHEDAERLADLAVRTFRDTFLVDNREEDIILHLSHSYGAARQRAEIEDPNMRTLLAEVGGVSAASAQVRAGPPPPCVTGPNPIELWRFYVDRPWIGRGVAQQLMVAARAEAEGLGGRTLWLGAWEKNARAIAFYRRCGFVDVGSHVYKVGHDAQTDRVMERSLSALQIVRI